jgi:hypothetical protein
MAKPVERENDSDAFIAMLEGPLKSLIDKLSTHKSTMDDVRAEMGALVNNAINDHNCHKGAVQWIRKLKGMDPAKRTEHLFHFDAYREHMGWTGRNDLLPDRQFDHPPWIDSPATR